MSPATTPATGSPARYREVVVSGTPRELGRQIGEAAGEEVRGFCEIGLSRVQKTLRVTRADAMQLAHDSISWAESYSPDMVEELRGTAEAARVSLTDLMLLQVRNQLQPSKEGGCTSLAYVGQTASGGVVAQNWDADPGLDPVMIVLTRRPTGKPAFMTITQAGLIAYIGFNAAGIGLCLNTLPAPARRNGVPHYFTVRGIFEANSLEGAVHAVERAERAIPANIMMLTPQGPADLEVTLEGVQVLRPESSNGTPAVGITHTNHCLSTPLVPINEQFPELIQSHSRARRINELLGTAEQRPVTIPQVQAALSDHDGHPRSICRHPNDDPGNGYWQTVFSVVMEPAAGRMHITRGTPCDHPFETYHLA